MASAERAVKCPHVLAGAFLPLVTERDERYWPRAHMKPISRRCGLLARFSRSAALVSGASLFAAMLAAGPGCSTGDGTLGGTLGGGSAGLAGACRDQDCLPGNKCLPLDGVTKCRKTCSSNADPATSCPFGYTCVAMDPEPFCVKDNADIAKKDSGQWGFGCLASKGVTNPGCDTDQSFYCYAQSKSDGAAYCTRYDCETDRDCAAGFYCATANASPNADTNAVSIGATNKVCLKRQYCAPCAADLDCPPLAGRPQHCVGGDDGVTFCAPECGSSKNCQKDAKCVAFDGYKACYPRAGVCVGDGLICSPCRSDADCQDGACVKGQYTEERSCAIKSKKPCTLPASGPQTAANYDCPKPTEPALSKRAVRCLGGAAKDGYPFPYVPKDYCHGLWAFGQSADVGCWTPDQQ